MMKRVFILSLLWIPAVVMAQSAPAHEARAIFTECQTTFSTKSITVAEGQALDGVVYPQTGIYVQSLTNAAGCDSIVTMDVTVLAGALPGKFSVSATDTVYFSKGNLQYCAAPASGPTSHKVKGGGTAPGIWRFAEHQYDMIGLPNTRVSANYSGWIDLFSWATSGWNSGVSGKTSYLPYANSSTASTYLYAGLTGTYANADWGVYNAISNGGNDPETQHWFTLSYAQWDYVLNKRVNATHLRSAASINGVCGYVILPDVWFKFEHAVDLVENSNAAVNAYNTEQWQSMERDGAVFFPCTGRRTSTNNVAGWEDITYYWSSEFNSSSNYGKLVQFTATSTSGSCSISDNGTLYYGRGVRVVRMANE